MNQHDSNIGTCEPLRVGSVLSVLLFGFSFTMLIMLINFLFRSKNSVNTNRKYLEICGRLQDQETM